MFLTLCWCRGCTPCVWGGCGGCRYGAKVEWQDPIPPLLFNTAPSVPPSVRLSFINATGHTLSPGQVTHQPFACTLDMYARFFLVVSRFGRARVCVCVTCVLRAPFQCCSLLLGFVNRFEGSAGDGGALHLLSTRADVLPSGVALFSAVTVPTSTPWANLTTRVVCPIHSNEVAVSGTATVTPVTLDFDPASARPPATVLPSSGASRITMSPPPVLAVRDSLGTVLHGRFAATLDCSVSAQAVGDSCADGSNACAVVATGGVGQPVGDGAVSFPSLVIEADFGAVVELAFACRRTANSRQHALEVLRHRVRVMTPTPVLVHTPGSVVTAGGSLFAELVLRYNTPMERPPLAGVHTEGKHFVLVDGQPFAVVEQDDVTQCTARLSPFVPGQSSPAANVSSPGSADGSQSVDDDGSGSDSGNYSGSSDSDSQVALSLGPATLTGGDASSSRGVVSFSQLVLRGVVGTKYTVTVQCRLGSLLMPTQVQFSVTSSACAAGFQPSTTGLACEACPAFHWSDDGNTQPCTRCPESGVSCAGGRLDMRPGYFLVGGTSGAGGGGGATANALSTPSLDGSAEFHSCPNPSACVLDTQNRTVRCDTGYKGVLCAVCDTDGGYQAQGSACVKCWGRGLNYAVLGVLALLVLFALVYISAFHEFKKSAASKGGSGRRPVAAWLAFVVVLCFLCLWSCRGGVVPVFLPCGFDVCVRVVYISDVPPTPELRHACRIFGSFPSAGSCVCIVWCHHCVVGAFAPCLFVVADNAFGR